MTTGSVLPANPGATFHKKNASVVGSTFVNHCVAVAITVFILQSCLSCNRRHGNKMEEVTDCAWDEEVTTSHLFDAAGFIMNRVNESLHQVVDSGLLEAAGLRGNELRPRRSSTNPRVLNNSAGAHSLQSKR